MSLIRRLYVKKKEAFAQEAARLCADIQENLQITALEKVAVYHRYDIEGLADTAYEEAKRTIFSEPPVDEIWEELPLQQGQQVMAVEYLPGQYDQRADSAMQCVEMLTLQKGCLVRTAQVFVFTGALTPEEMEKIRTYCINPVEAREASLEAATSLALPWEAPQAVECIAGFIDKTVDELESFRKERGLAMSLDDLQFCQTYFKETEKRNPTITEILVLDTYWSDHCRHTTFMTELTDISIDQSLFTAPIQRAYDTYQTTRALLYTEKYKPQSLMDMATIAVKALRKEGKLQEMDESDEINACTIIVPVEVDGQEEEWLLLFKNETHNHPTEIEPFGGAATCLGGCIRDPLSGRAYVYQAMRVTGSGDPRQAVQDTLKGKLPQRTITTTAAKGYSSYGNQIGLATGEVKEYYHPGYIAKRMEIGAVVAAAPRKNVVRLEPVAGDVVILLGGKTGRDGMGGATGSSKEHTIDSLETCGAEVQKGNALTERKIQRLFRRGEATVLIKRCNDFGAGGVSVAIGELTDGVHILLDKVPKKYEGLDGTELAISESQERMAVVVRAEDASTFCSYAAEENLEATIVATVTDTNRLVMEWQGTAIVDISRDFLNTNGVAQQRAAQVTAPAEASAFVPAEIDDMAGAYKETMASLAVASQQGMAERFDSTIGSGTVLMPFGGTYQKTPVEGMVAKLPVLHGETKTVSIMTHGFDPVVAMWSPFHGALYAVLHSVAKLVALGGDRKKIYLTLQEYFEKLGTDTKAWGKPVSALLGAFTAQRELEIGAIGGKDSMSGTFEDWKVPPSLISFAVAPGTVEEVVSPELKRAGSALLLFDVPRNEEEMPDFAVFKAHCDLLHKGAVYGSIHAMQAVGAGGIGATLAKMAFGNRIGVEITKEWETKELFALRYGAFVVETDEATAAIWSKQPHVHRLGTTTNRETIEIGTTVLTLADLQEEWEKPLRDIFPLQSESSVEQPTVQTYTTYGPKRTTSFGKPNVFIPVFPGTNCEFDSARAFEKAGATTDIFVLRNRTSEELADSIKEMVARIEQAQIIMFPGGFSAGDEPDGSGKFIATLFRNPALSEALEELLYKRDGLALGICNGFQALIKLGLLPYGHVRTLEETSPTLTYNTIGRHISRMVQTKVVSVKSPWFATMKVGDIHTVAVSHGEGRFIASKEQIEALAANGQIATQYVDLRGEVTNDSDYNPNQSLYAIEGITSPDGRVLGKMAHSERVGYGVAMNCAGEKVQPIFAAGVGYFK